MYMCMCVVLWWNSGAERVGRRVSLKRKKSKIKDRRSKKTDAEIKLQEAVFFRSFCEI
jgi:hypothetical protein